MRTRTFGFRVALLLALAIATTLGIAAGLYALLRASETGASTQQTRLTETKNTAYLRLESLSGMQNQLSAMLRLKDPDELEQALDRYNAILTGVRASLKQAAPGTAGNTIAPQLDALAAANQQAIDRLLLGEAGGAYEILVTHVGPAYAALLAGIRTDNANTEQALAAAATAATARRQHWVHLALLGCATLLLLFTAYGLHFHRALNRELRKTAGGLDVTAGQVAATAGQVSTSAQALAQGASEQAASLEETSASLEELTSMTKRNADNAAQAKDLSGQTRAAADAGAADMTEMNGAMDAIKLSSGEIAKIVKTIDEIAFQTNILALNAAVEAARAGEAGAGFAVVAEEVRALAQRSAVAARETASKIEDSVNKSEHGVSISRKVAQSLQQIVERARKVDALVAEIATASSEQSQGIGQVNLAVAQMDKVTQSNAAAAEESAAAVAELNAQAVAVKEVVATLHQLVGGIDAAPAGPATPPAPAAAGQPAAPHQTLVRPRSHSAPQPAVTADHEHDAFFKDT